MTLTPLGFRFRGTREASRLARDRRYPSPMRILVLGGTGLTGTAVVAEAMRRGHEVTSVHRGRMPSSGLPSCEQVVLNREDGHTALAAQGWDAVIDVSGYVPAVVRDALVTLCSPSTRWLFVSSTSVFAERDVLMQSEEAPLVQFTDAELRRDALSNPGFDWRAHQVYGECKVLCEELVRNSNAASAAILRPCVIAGAHDSTWRFPYWVDRAGRGGSIVAPAPKEAPVAVIDVRDLAAFALQCVESSVTDTFVLAPQPELATMECLIDCVRAAFPEVDSSVEWMEPETLRGHGVEPWAGLPFWLPAWTGSQGFNAFDASRSYAAGFVPRPLTDTAASVRDWLASADDLPSQGITLTELKEREVLGHVVPDDVT